MKEMAVNTASERSPKPPRSGTPYDSGSRLAWPAFGLITLLFMAGLILALLNREASSSATSSWGSPGFVTAILLALEMFSFPAIGILVAARHPRSAIGWLLLSIGLVWGVILLLDNYILYGFVAEPQSVPRPDVALAMDEWLWVPGIGLMGTFLILLFPNGRLPSPRWRPMAWLSAISLILPSIVILFSPGSYADSGYSRVTNPFGIESLASVLGALQISIALIPLCIVGCALSLIQRFRRSQGQERLQLKWLAAGAGAVAGIYLVMMAVTVPFSRMPDTPLWVELAQDVALSSFILIPVAVGVAILKHRLYDIDLIVNRTLVYASLTAVLALVYVTSVVVIGTGLRSITGSEGNNLGVAVSTLAVAALFRPARARIQAFIDRRFYRRKYDAAQTLESFSTQVRDEVHLAALTDGLLAIVIDTMQPAHASLWLSGHSERSMADAPAGGGPGGALGSHLPPAAR